MEERYSKREKNKSMVHRRSKEGRKISVITVLTINMSELNSILDQQTNSQFRLKE